MEYVITANDRVAELRDDGTWSYSEAQPGCLQRLQQMQQSPDAVKLSQGLYDRMGVQIIDTGEELTGINKGDRIEFIEGIDSKTVDFSVKVYAYQMDALIASAEKGFHSEMSRFLFIREFFLASNEGRSNILNNPLIANPLLRFVIKGKKMLHLYLVSPDPNLAKDASYTLFFVDGHWNVARGIYGTAQRVFRVTTDEAYELHKHMYQGMKSHSFFEWYKIAKWYVGWRNKVEMTPA
jgi:hypothetical protein